MPTAPSSTDRPAGRTGLLAEPVRAARDLGALLYFRLAGLRGKARRAAPLGLCLMVLISVATATVPALLPEQSLSRSDVRLLMPSLLVSLLVVSIASSAASGGGRELLAREQAVAFPVSPTTDHLGALLMAPLNIAWLVQAWAALAASAYVVTARPALLGSLLLVVLWLVVATTVAQAVAWGVEWVRRGPHGTLLVRCTTTTVAAGVAVLVVRGDLVDVLDHSPSRLVADGIADAGHRGTATYGALVLGLVALASAAVAVGAWAAGRLARRPAATSCGGRPRTTPRGRTRAPTCSPWCGWTARGSGAACPCDGAWRCSRSSRAWWRSAARSTGRCSGSSPGWWPRAERCCSA